MTDTQKKKIKEMLDTLPEVEKDIYREIAEYAVELGYLPCKIKNAHGEIVAVAFSKSKINRRLIKITPPYTTTGKDLTKTSKAGLGIAFFAAEYSDYFHDKVCKDIEKGIICGSICENCAGKYKYVYPDGSTAFRCSIHSLVDVSPIGTEHIGEIKKMMKMQNDFWLK